ncbi:MAG TPA: tetratricopeptide repeat-containing protein [Gemmataceae bacterium]|nr:tetratricopeptide repeat-containing protein [Gemmataceae bacterium]
MVSFGKLTSGVRAECAAILNVLRLLRPQFWLAWSALIPFSVVGLMGGAVGVWAQSAVLVGLAAVGLFSGSIARWVRRRRWVRYPDGPEVAPFLSQLITILVAPLYFVAMAVLFARLNGAFPGALPVSSWRDALVLSCDTVLHGQVFFDVLETFDWRLISPADNFCGRSVIFVSRFLMDLVFLKLLLQALSAGVYRARGLGRGEDVLFQLREALRACDAARTRHLARSVDESLRSAVDALAAAVQAGTEYAGEARRALAILRNFSLPYLRHCAEVLAGDERRRLLSLIDELRHDAEPPHSSRALARHVRKLVMGGVLVACAAAPFFVGTLPALVLALAMSGLLTWVLVGSRGWLDRLARWRVICPLAPKRFPFAVAAVSLLAAPLLIATESVVFRSVYALDPGIFAAAEPGDVDHVSAAAYVLANLLRTDVFLDIADTYHLKVPRLAPTGFLGCLLTFITRTVFDMGLISVVLSFAGVLFNRVWRRFPVTRNAELELRTEAEECGPHAALLVGWYYGEIGDYLVDCFEAQRSNEGLFVALAASGFLPHYQHCYRDRQATGTDLARAGWHVRVGEALREQLRRHREAVLELEEAVRILGRPEHATSAPHRELLVRARGQLAVTLWYVGRPDEAVAQGRQAVVLGHRLRDEGIDCRAAQGYAHYALGLAQLGAGQVEEGIRDEALAVELFEQARARAEGIECALVWARVNIAGALHAAGRPPEAVSEGERVIAFLDESIRAGRAEFREMLAVAENNLASALDTLGRVTDARPHCRRAVVVLGELWREGECQNEAVEAHLHNSVGLLLQSEANLGVALPEFRAALAIRRRLIRAGQLELRDAWADSLVGLATALTDQGELDGAVAAAEQALEIRARLVHEEKHGSLCDSLAATYAALAGALGRQGRLAEAEQRYRQAVQLGRQGNGAGLYGLLARYRGELSNVLRAAGRTAEAEEEARTAVRDLEGRPELRLSLAVAILSQGWSQQQRGASSAAVAAFRRALRLLDELAGEGQSHVGRYTAAGLQGLGWSLLFAGRTAEAEGAFRAANDRFATLVADGCLEFIRNQNESRIGLGLSLCALGRPREGERQLHQAVESVGNSVRHGFSQDRLLLAQARGSLSTALRAQGRHAEALDELTHARSLFDTLIGEGMSHLQPARAEVLATIAQMRHGA